MKPTTVAGVLALALRTAGCTTVLSREQLGPDERWTYTVRELPGRRGEQLRGVLSFRGRRVPLYFSEVVVGSRRYTAALRTTGDEFQGYREDAGFLSPDIRTVAAELSQAEKTRG